MNAMKWNDSKLDEMKRNEMKLMKWSNDWNIFEWMKKQEN